MRGGNTALANTKINLFFVEAAFLAMTSFALSANAQIDQQSQAELTAPLEPLRPGVTEIQIFDELLAHNALRSATLLEYSALRTYQVVDLKGKVHAEEVGRMEYRAPDQKTFVITSKNGSGMVRRLALNPLIASEIETTAGKQHHDSAISPSNYVLEPLGEQQVALTTASSCGQSLSGKTSICLKARSGLTLKITRLSGLKAIRQRSFLSG